MKLFDSILRTLTKPIAPRFRLPLQYYYCGIRGILEKELLQLGCFTTKGDRAIDIGANVGLWSFALSRYFRCVEAFEPIPAYAEYMKAARLRGVTVYNVALSSTNGNREIRIPTNQGKPVFGLATLGDVAENHIIMTIPVHALDEYNFKDVGFIKIDVEGHELEVVEGAKSTICREKPVMLVEIEQRFHEFPMDKIVQYVISLGYEAYFLNENNLHPYSEFSYEIYQKPYLSQIASRCDDLPGSYINNFIFKPVNSPLK